MGYEFFDHTADAKFRAYGKTLEEAFCNVAYAMTEIIIGDKQKVDPVKQLPLRLEASDMKGLLYDFMDHLLFLLDVEHFLTGNIVDLEIKNLGKKFRLEATLEGDRASDYEVVTHIKAATYAEMEITHNPDRVIIQAVVDL